MKKILLSIITLAAVSASVYGQTAPRTAYFLDGYSYRHLLNPAFASSRSYFTLPVMGYTDFSLQSDMGMKTFLYPYNGQLTTFMNGAVSADEFLGKLNRNNLVNANISTPLVSLGKWGKSGKGFTVVDLSIKSENNVNLPYDLFDFMKNVGTRQQYDISNLGIKSRSYIQLAIGHTHKIGERISVGGKMKFLLGLPAAELNIDNMQVSLNEDKWSVKATGSLSTTIPGLDIPKRADGSLDLQNANFNMDNVTGSDPDASIGTLIKNTIGNFIGGYGAALDLGVNVEVIKGLSVSAAILDLGLMQWNNRFAAKTGDNYWEFTGFENVDLNGEGENSIGNQLEQIGSDFSDFIVMYEDSESVGKKWEFLSCTMNIGAEYKMPFYRRLSVGALSSTRFNGAYTWTEGRFSLNLAPLNWISMSASYGISNFGSTFGAMLNIHTAAFSLFFGSDTFLLNFAPAITDCLPAMYQFDKLYTPLDNLNVHLNFGLTFNISKRRDL